MKTSLEHGSYLPYTRSIGISKLLCDQDSEEKVPPPTVDAWCDIQAELVAVIPPQRGHVPSVGCKQEVYD